MDSPNKGFYFWLKKKQSKKLLNNSAVLLTLLLQFMSRFQGVVPPTIPLSRLPLWKGDGLQMSSKRLFAFNETIKTGLAKVFSPVVVQFRLSLKDIFVYWLGLIRLGLFAPLILHLSHQLFHGKASPTKMELNKISEIPKWLFYQAIYIDSNSNNDLQLPEVYPNLLKLIWKDYFQWLWYHLYPNLSTFLTLP